MRIIVTIALIAVTFCTIGCRRAGPTNPTEVEIVFLAKDEPSIGCEIVTEPCFLYPNGDLLFANMDDESAVFEFTTGSDCLVIEVVDSENTSDATISETLDELRQHVERNVLNGGVFHINVYLEPRVPIVISNPIVE